MYRIISIFLLIAALAESRLPKSEHWLPLIVGGEEATPHEFPWMVSIQRASHSCGGMIVNAGWILTAAHCSESAPSVYTIVAGEHNLTQAEGSEQRSAVSGIFIHEGYDDYYLENDIALMKLSTPFQYNDKVQPGRLAGSNFVAEGMMTVAGWGRLEYQGSLPDVLMKVEVPLIDLEVCRNLYSDELNPVFDHNICAGYLEGEKDSCNGDSGGPLMCPGQAGLNWTICGLVSWGGHGEGSCAYPDEPGVYTAVAPFYRWIWDTIASKK